MTDEAKLKALFYWGGATLCAGAVCAWLGIAPGLAVSGFAIAAFPIIRG